MAKFSDFVKASVFSCADGFDKLTPEISVILPTFKRGDNGLFQKSVDSLLAQTFKNFELIIIDDGSSDSTAEHIKKYMSEDARVAVIRHPENIGLSAVSQDEGFLRSRGAFYFYAFDDNEYDVSAMETLLKFLEENPDLKAVYGASEFVLPNGNVSLIGDEDLDLDRLFTLNYIPNSPVLMRRELIDEIGFYDPHISMVRLCDWDLWCRIARKYPVGRVDKTLVKELSLSLPDSLANSYPLSKAAVRERMFTDRNDRLKPESIFDMEIDDISPRLSKRSQEEIKEIAETKFSRFFWSKKQYSVPEQSGKYLLAVVNCIEASVDMFFSSHDTNVIVLNELSLAEEMAYHLKNASAVVFCRYVSENYLTYAEACRRAGTPYYYCTDENFFDLGMMSFSHDLKYFLDRASGIMVSTAPLQKYFEERGFSEIQRVVPVVFRKSETFLDDGRFKNPKELGFLYASNMRMDGLTEFREVLKDLRRKYKIRFFIFDRQQQHQEMTAFAEACKQDEIEVKIIKGERSYDAFLNKLKPLPIHFILHPEGKNDEFRNNCKNKTLNFIATGVYASAFVFVPDIFPFSRVRDEYGITGAVYKQPKDIEEQIERLLSDKAYVHAWFNKEVSLCEKEMNPETNDRLFLKLLEASPSKRKTVQIQFKDRFEVFLYSLLTLFSLGKLHKKLKKKQKS